MLNNKDRASLRSYENRLENEHNDPEPADFEECRHCDDLTEPNPKEMKECGECYNPYGLDEDATHEYHQNQIGDLEKKNKEQASGSELIVVQLGLARESIHYWQERHKDQAARIAELERWHKNNVKLIAELIHQTDEVLGPKIAELKATITGYQTMYPPKK